MTLAHVLVYGGAGNYSHSHIEMYANNDTSYTSLSMVVQVTIATPT